MAEPNRAGEASKGGSVEEAFLQALHAEPGDEATWLALADYIHSHMDEENFDVARVMKCCVGVPEADGSNIPTCSYNVLYREKDRRFAAPEMLRRMEQTRPRLSLPTVTAGPAGPALNTPEEDAP